MTLIKGQLPRLSQLLPPMIDINRALDQKAVPFLCNASVAEVTRHLQHHADSGADLAYTFPLLSTVASVVIPKTIPKMDKTGTVPSRKQLRLLSAVTSDYLIEKLIRAPEQERNAMWLRLLHNYIAAITDDTIRRQLSFHAWASTSVRTESSEVGFLTPGNPVAGVVLPFSLLVTPTKPMVYAARRTSLNSAEIVSTTKWIRSTVFNFSPL